MNFVSVEFIGECMLRTTCSCWSIFDAQKKRVDEQTDKKTPPAASFAILKKSIANMSGEFCRVVLTKQSQKGLRGATIPGAKFTYYVALKSNAVVEEVKQPLHALPFDAAPGSYGFTIIQQLQKENYDLRVANEKEKFQKQLDELNSKIASIGSTNTSRTDKLLDLVLAKVLAASDLQPVNEQVAAPVAETINGHDTPKDTTATKTELVNAINELKSVDADFITTMRKLAKFAKDNPAVYNEYKKQM